MCVFSKNLVSGTEWNNIWGTVGPDCSLPYEEVAGDCEEAGHDPNIAWEESMACEACPSNKKRNFSKRQGGTAPTPAGLKLFGDQRARWITDGHAYNLDPITFDAATASYTPGISWVSSFALAMDASGNPVPKITVSSDIAGFSYYTDPFSSDNQGTKYEFSTLPTCQRVNQNGCHLHFQGAFMNDILAARCISSAVKSAPCKPPGALCKDYPADIQMCFHKGFPVGNPPCANPCASTPPPRG
jgi:hypothetical protein